MDLADLQQITAFIAADNFEVAERFANRLVDLAESLRFDTGARTTGEKVAWRPCARLVSLFDFLSLRKTS